MPKPIADRYRAATRDAGGHCPIEAGGHCPIEAGGHCPIEAGVLGRLADHECPHGRLPGDRTPKCGAGHRRTRA